MNIDSFEKYFHPSWWIKLKPFLESKDFEVIWNKLKDLGSKGKVVYPYSKLLKETIPSIENTIFNPFLMDFNDIEVLFLTELTNKFTYEYSIGCLLDNNYYNAVEKSIHNGLNINMDKSYNFSYLKDQGVFILGNSLTSEIDLPHYPLWESFLREVLSIIVNNNKGLHIVLLGSNTHKYEKVLNKDFNYIYKSNMNYDNYDMFSIINERMLKNQNKIINWTQDVLEEAPF